MNLGLFGLNSGLCARDPGVAVRVATAAEAAGWESVWAGEHYVLPDPAVAASPAPAGFAMLDPFVSLAQVATVTDRLLLATGVVVLPLHHPLMLAKKVASLDRVSGGRVLFGVGVGYLAPEFDAFGVPLSDRGARSEEHLDAVRAVWAADRSAAFDGPRVSYGAVRAEPRPVQGTDAWPGPPLHVGGHSAAALDRAVRRGHGWYGWALDPAAARDIVTALRRRTELAGRTAELGDLQISVSPPAGTAIDEALVAAYAEAGVDRLVVVPSGADLDDEAALLRLVTSAPDAARRRTP